MSGKRKTVNYSVEAKPTPKSVRKERGVGQAFQPDVRLESLTYVIASECFKPANCNGRLIFAVDKSSRRAITLLCHRPKRMGSMDPSRCPCNKELSMFASRKRFGKSKQVRRTSGQRPCGSVRQDLWLEPLEARELLTWTALQAQLPNLPNTKIPDQAQAMVLLSDGSVMVQGGGDSASTAWYRLTPDSNGSYIDGSWSTLKPMNVGRLFYGTNVLPKTGNVFFVGGEVATDKPETNATEIFNPLANQGAGSWTSEAPYAQDSSGNNTQTNFGDGPSEVLSDGRVLAGSQYGSTAYIYNPTSNAWVAATTAANASSGNFGEEGWVKLPDDSILDYKIGSQTAQRFVLGATDSQNQWLAAGNVPVSLATNGGDASINPELGPGLLLPSGKVFWIGATSSTALYDPSNPTNPWSQGTNIPNDSKGNAVGAIDAPGAVEPDGKVLFAVSPNTGITGGSSPNFPGPTTIDEYDPTNGQITAVSMAGGPTLAGPAFLDRMLVLPTHQILFSSNTGQLYVYQGDITPQASWKPTVSNIARNADGTYTLTGFQLNGMTEGAAYGDDAEMASNYPIVQYTNTFGDPYFARTFNWSSTGVQTGATLETTQLTLPNGLAPGAYLVQAIANGISSNNVLDILTDANHNSITLQLDPADSSQLQILNNGSLWSEWPVSDFNSVIVTEDSANTSVTVGNLASGMDININEGTGTDTVSIPSLVQGAFVNVYGNGNDHVTVGAHGSAQSIQGRVTTVRGLGGVNLTVDDSKDTAARTKTPVQITGTGSRASFLVRLPFLPTVWRN
jgi:hypothetical protein